jgi:hypothetical protein
LSGFAIESAATHAAYPTWQGCQMVCFQTKNPTLGKFWRALDWKNGYIFEISGIFYRRLGYFKTIWYILCSFDTFFLFWYYGREKSGNPAT